MSTQLNPYESKKIEQCELSDFEYHLLCEISEIRKSNNLTHLIVLILSTTIAICSYWAVIL